MTALNQTPPPLQTEVDDPQLRGPSWAWKQWFQLLFSNLRGLLNSLGGQYLNFPYAAVSRTTNKTFAANTATLITFDTTEFANGASNATSDGVAAAVAGLYNYQFSIQYANPDTQTHSAWVWLRVNNVDVPRTSSKFDVTAKHGSSDGYLVVAANFYVQLAAGDHVELWGAVDSTSLYMEAYAAQTSPFAMPAIPSVAATLSFVSRVP